MQILFEGSISANKYIELFYQYLIQYPLNQFYSVYQTLG